MSGDQFDDMNLDASHGIFGSDAGGLVPDALTRMKSVKSTITRDGAVLAFNCPGCQVGKQITVEWPEAVSIAFGIAPQMVFGGTTWVLDPEHQAFYPQEQCTSCGSAIPILITPVEAKGYVDQGSKRGALQSQQYQAIMARVQQVRQQYQQR